MLSIDLKDTYFQVSVHPGSRPYLRFVGRESVPVQGILFQPFYSSPGLYQSVCSGFGVGSLEGDPVSSLSGWLASCCEVSFFLL